MDLPSPSFIERCATIAIHDLPEIPPACDNYTRWLYFFTWILEEKERLQVLYDFLIERGYARLAESYVDSCSRPTFSPLETNLCTLEGFTSRAVHIPKCSQFFLLRNFLSAEDFAELMYSPNPWPYIFSKMSDSMINACVLNIIKEVSPVFYRDMVALLEPKA